MVQAIIDISDKANMVLNVVKAKYGLRDKSQAIDVVAEAYGKEILELELRPEYVEKAKRISGQKAIKVGSVEALRKRHQSNVFSRD